MINTIINTNEDAFWFTTAELTTRFAHETARKGAKFFDGNNGDKWTVVSIDRDAKTIIVRNVTQDQEPTTFAWA